MRLAEFGRRFMDMRQKPTFSTDFATRGVLEVSDWLYGRQDGLIGAQAAPLILANC